MVFRGQVWKYLQNWKIFKNKYSIFLSSLSRVTSAFAAFAALLWTLTLWERRILNFDWTSPGCKDGQVCVDLLKKMLFPPWILQRQKNNRKKHTKPNSIQTFVKSVSMSDRIAQSRYSHILKIVLNRISAPQNKISTFYSKDCEFVFKYLVIVYWMLGAISQ